MSKYSSIPDLPIILQIIFFYYLSLNNRSDYIYNRKKAAYKKKACTHAGAFNRFGSRRLKLLETILSSD